MAWSSFSMRSIEPFLTRALSRVASTIMNAAPVRAWLFLVGLLTIALCLGWVWRDHGRDDANTLLGERAQMRVSALGVAPDAGTADQRAGRNSAAKHAPALDRPLLDRVPALRQRAQSGDAKAACQLALELSACRTAAQRDDLSMTMEYVAATSEQAGRDVRVIDAIASAREAADGALADCAGLDTQGESDVVALLQAAAPAGNARQRVIAALTQPDGSLLRLPRGSVHPLPMDPWVSTLASQFYADHALRYLHEGFRARDPLALEGLILLHAPDILVPSASTDVAFRLPDPRRFVALSLLAEQVYGSDMLGSQVRQLLQRALETLPANERRRAEREATRWAQTWRSTPPLRPPDEGIDAQSIKAVCQ